MSTPPLIVHVIHRLDYGGLENGLVNLINHMPEQRYRHAIVCLAGYGDFRSRIRRGAVEVYSLDKRPGKDPAAYVRLWRLLRRLRPAIVHSRNLGTVDAQWVAAAAGTKQRVHGEHGWDASDPQGRNRRHLRIRRLCRPAVQRYVAVSKDLARWLESAVHVDPARIEQIYNGVDTSRFVPEGDLPADLPWPTTGPARPVVFGTVARLDPVKNQTELLTAFAAARRRSSTADLRLIIVGDGPLRGELETRTRDLGIAAAVWFTGARDDVPALLRATDVFILPSLNEGISNTILEAMATGRPVIASRVGGNPELLDGGKYGMLYEGGAEELAAAMSIYASDPAQRQAHGAAARARAEQTFSLPAMVRGYLRLYDGLTER